jgi:hypothetical protein
MSVSFGQTAPNAKATTTIHVLRSSTSPGVGFSPLSDSLSVPVTQIDVSARMPDGSEATLTCKQQVRYCTLLDPGDYSAQIEKDVIWVYVPRYTDSPHYTSSGVQEPRKTKLERVKYRIVSATSPH